jgi:hypothetical protein
LHITITDSLHTFMASANQATGDSIYTVRECVLNV